VEKSHQQLKAAPEAAFHAAAPAVILPKNCALGLAE